MTAILPDLSLAEVAHFARQSGYSAVEVMCWPPGKAERRYAGVTHIDVVDFTDDDAQRVRETMAEAGVSISGLGYYPNPLVADASEAQVYMHHIGRVIVAAKRLGVPVVNTFVGRDPAKTVDDDWPRFLEVWKPLIALADEHGIKVGIENCPMSFTRDEWPGGKNLATSPAIWRRMFNDIPSANFGLNFDPSHFVFQHMDYCKAMREFASRIHHVHAKDVRLDQERLDEVGILAYPNLYHTPKLPGLGDVNWSRFFSTLTETGYSGAVCVEVEDRAFEGSLENRKASLRQSYNYLKQFVP
ncbi:MAG: sugar phosphate isomerase/epimerase [Bryobacterales bacterium]|nr:sugar phosphate isomerase/epimerase [Bryobacterales bacterium]